MGASTTDIATLRRRIAEPTEATYSDEVLTAIIEGYALIDADEWEPDDAGWTPTYDLAAAAGRVWAEKAAALASGYDFSADGGSYSRSQAYEMHMKQARYWDSRRAPAALRLHVAHDYEKDYQANPANVSRPDSWVVNAPEAEDYE